MYLNELRRAGTEELTVVLTGSAERFLPAATLRTICEEVCTDTDPGPGHVTLARRADRVLVLPATAHLLGCIAGGLAPSLLTTLVLAHTWPLALVPAMNPQMWRNTAVRRN